MSAIGSWFVSVVVALVVLAAMFGGLVVAWRDWARNHKQSFPLWRSLLAFAAVIGATAHISILVVCLVGNAFHKTFEQKLHWFGQFGRIDFYLFCCVILLGLLSKGRCRIGTLASALATELTWFFFAAGF
jgi:hypothetical protein